MPSAFHPQLSHCGVYARDVSKMVDFYTDVVGLVVSDRGISSRGGELAFMTASPEHHHQFVIVSGRSSEGVTTVNQVSFKVPDLDALKTVFARARDAGIETIRQTSHGNALSCYFPDPEGQHDRGLYRHTLVRAAAAWRADRSDLADRRDQRRQRTALSRDAGLYAARRVAGRSQKPARPLLTVHCGRVGASRELMFQGCRIGRSRFH